MTLLRENAILLALMVFAALLGPIGVLASAPLTEQSDVVLVVGPRAAAAVAAGGGKPLGPAQPRFAVMVDGTQLHVAQMPKKGVWGVFDATRLAALCRVDGEGYD